MKQFLSALIFCAPIVVWTHAADGAPPRARKLPRPDHIVIVVEENRSYKAVIGNRAAPYINALARGGALFSRSYAVAHPSQPNYLALFSGSTQDVADDSCPHTFSGDNLASVLIRAGVTFEIYSESLPAIGYTGCIYGNYQRKHNPAVNWQGVNVPPGVNLPFRNLPSNYALLPSVAMVVPNQENDMHDGTEPAATGRGDAWLKTNLNGYVRWARTHNSLLIVTWDEDDGSDHNRIPTLFVGPMVRQGVYSRRIDHYDLLRTILDMYGVAPLGDTATAQPIDYVWARTIPTQKPGTR